MLPVGCTEDGDESGYICGVFMVRNTFIHADKHQYKVKDAKVCGGLVLNQFYMGFKCLTPLVKK